MIHTGETALGHSMSIRSKIILGFAAAAMIAAAPVSAQERTVHGFWEQADDNGKVGGWFLMYERDGMFQGALVRAFDKPGDPVVTVCTKCPGDQKNAPMMGLVIIKNMQRRGLAYENGNILDPRDGSIYKAKMEMSPDGQRLAVRGFLGIELFGQTQTWRRLPDTAIPASELPPQLHAYLPTGSGPKPPSGAKTLNVPPQPRRQP